MSDNEAAKKEAQQTITDELANQPKQDTEGTDNSKEKRAAAEVALKDIKTGEASTK